MSNFHKIKNYSLFNGIDETDFDKMLQCLAAFEKKVGKNDFIARAEEPVQYVGIILKGRVHVFHEDFWGNRRILANIGEGGMFCEAFVCGEQDLMPVSVLAQIDTEVLMLDYRKIMVEGAEDCRLQQCFQLKLIKNMLKIMAEKNIFLTQKMEQISKRTTKEKIMSYLSYESIRRKKEAFDISLDRQELADYLAVDRSALSRVLSELKKEGIIDYKKNHFRLYKKD